jgi:hypothetical protein
MKKRVILVWFVVGCLLTPVFFLLGGYYSGGGHSLTSMIILFPWGMMWGLTFKGDCETPAVILLALQFPAYAVILAFGRLSRRLLLCLLLVLLLHVLAVTIGLRIQTRQRRPPFQYSILIGQPR